MTYSTSPQAKQAIRIYRYYVQLASTKVDFQGVPESTRMVDVVVTEPTKQAIAVLVAAAGWLRGYKVVTYWTPQEDDCAAL